MRDFSALLTKAGLPSACFVIDEKALLDNLNIINEIKTLSGAKVLLTLKAFCPPQLADLILSKLDGVACSSTNEIRFAKDYFSGGEIVSFSPAYEEDELVKALSTSDKVIFNSYHHYGRHKDKIEAHKRINKRLQIGLRINPEMSMVKTKMYDPCRPFSRLGHPISDLLDKDLSMFDGFHFHALCDQQLNSLKTVLKKIEILMGSHLADAQWINFGGGQQLTHPEYDGISLASLICDFRKKYQIDVYLEPGAAVAYDVGVLLARVVDVVDNNLKTAILNVSANSHMPDVIEYPYTPFIDSHKLSVRGPVEMFIGGKSCLAGDVFGLYKFSEELSIGDRILFTDAIQYSMVKGNHFNGLQPPQIVIWNSTTDTVKKVSDFGFINYLMQFGDPQGV